MRELHISWSESWELLIHSKRDLHLKKGPYPEQYKHEIFEKAREIYYHDHHPINNHLLLMLRIVIIGMIIVVTSTKDTIDKCY